jgi:hypothetical protein
VKSFTCHPPPIVFAADAIRYADYASTRRELTINISGGVHHEILVGGNRGSCGLMGGVD